MNLCQSLVYSKYSIDFKEFEPRSLQGVFDKTLCDNVCQ